MSTMFFKCPFAGCKNEFEANVVVHKGGVNDYGWWVIKCNACGNVFDLYFGRDVNDSSLTSGGTILERLDREVYNEDDVKDSVKKHSLK